jgi:hypothetical protein
MDSTQNVVKIISMNYDLSLMLKVYLGFNVEITVQAKLHGVRAVTARAQELPPFVENWARGRTIVAEVCSSQDAHGLWPVVLMSKDPTFTTPTLNEALVDYGLAESRRAPADNLLDCLKVTL